MDYQRDEFLRLIEAVEDQGGTHLDQTCSMTAFEEWTGDKAVTPYYHPGCGHNALFEVPYLPRDDEMTGLMEPPVKVCAVEDSMGSWPRFKDKVTG